jgi:hypothetical protein
MLQGTVTKEPEKVTAAAAVAPNAAIDLGEYIRDVAPYPEEKAKRIEMFFKKRERLPKLFTYNEAGDLEIRSKTGGIEETIVLQTFVPISTDVRETLDQERLDALGEATSQYEAALDVLRKATANYKITGATQPVIAAQKTVSEADQILTRVRYGTRSIQNLMNPEVREVIFNQPYETRRLFPMRGDPYRKQLYRLAVLELPLSKFYGNYVDTPDAVPGQDVDATMDTVVPSDGVVRQKLRDGRWARIFFETEDGPSGFLTPFWPAEFTMDSVRYLCAFQAFEYQRASEAGHEGLKKNILQTRSTRTIRFLTKKLETQPKDVKGLWLRIFTAVYQQHPELRDRLLQTGTDALVFADVRKGPSGIGFSENTKECLDPSKWTGENAVGLALETLRYQFREGSAKEAALDMAPTESVITEEQQEKAKVGAIIGQKKRFFPRRPGA